MFGARGITTVDITVYGPRAELHSGHYGNWAPNPAMELAQLLGSMKDANGHVTIPHFYDGVKPLGERVHAHLLARAEVERAAGVLAGGQVVPAVPLGLTRRVLDEVIRLYPPVWLISRRAIRDTELGGYLVPAGTLICLTTWRVLGLSTTTLRPAATYR